MKIKVLKSLFIMDEITAMVRVRKNRAVITVGNYTEPLLDHLIKVVMYKNSTGSLAFWQKELFNQTRNFFKILNENKGMPFKKEIYLEGMFSIIDNERMVKSAIRGAVYFEKEPILSKKQVMDQWDEISSLIKSYCENVAEAASKGEDEGAIEDKLNILVHSLVNL